MAEGAEERLAEVLGLLKIPVVGRVLSGVIPNPFGGVEFRPVGRQWEYLDITAVLGEPLVGFLFFVIRGVVLD